MPRNTNLVYTVCDFYKKVKEEEYLQYKGKAINTVYIHFTVKPFPDRDGIIKPPGVSAGERAHCTQPKSLRLPETLMEAIPKGNVEQCDIILED